MYTKLVSLSDVSEEMGAAGSGAPQPHANPAQQILQQVPARLGTALTYAIETKDTELASHVLRVYTDSLASELCAFWYDDRKETDVPVRARARALAQAASWASSSR